jgi:hypothetical protein
MDIVVKRRNPGSHTLPMPQKLAPYSPYDRRIGEWGRVELRHSEDNTVDIYLDSGVLLNRVPVASKEWVISGEDADTDYNSGERDLPPEHARVFVMMPARTYDDCFIMPFSGFSTISRPAPYMEGDKERIKERITPSGWHITDDHGTGSHKAVSPDEKTSLEIDYGTEKEPKEDAPELHLSLFDEIKVDVAADDSAALSVFDEVEIAHKKGDSVKIRAYDTEITVKNGDVQVKTTKKTITTQDIDIKSTAPIGLNDGLYSTGLNPYLTAEASALQALQTAASNAAVQLGVLDGFSGAAGTIVGLGTAIVVFCQALTTADGAAQAAIAKVAK